MYMCPLKTKISGPAGIQKDGDDIIDETLNFFRVNVLYKTFALKGTADVALVYLTVFT